MALEAGSVYAVLGGKFMPTGFAQFDAAMKKSSASAAAAEAQIGRSSGRSAAAMGALGTAAKTGAAAGLIAVGAAAVSSVKSAQTFQKQISELKAVTQASAKDMQTMRKAALDLGASTGIGATKAAQALTELAKGGLSSEKAIGALKGTIALAQAGGLDLATAGETVANALNLFKLRGEDATMVADNFANAANATTADVGFFAQGLAQGGAAAKAAGLSFQETTVFLEAMAANGFKSGSDAGTSMKTALIQLANPTARAKEAAKQLGVAFYDSNGAMRPLPAIAKDLGNAFDGMSKKEKLATATRLVGTDGMRALLALADQGPAKLKGFADANAQTGAAARVAAEKMNNFEGSGKRLSAALESLKIEAGTALIPALTTAANGLAKFFNQMRAGEGTAGAIGKAFKGIGLAIGSLAGSRAAMASFSQMLPDSFVSGALTALGAVRALIAGFNSLASVGAKLPGPMSLPYKAIAQSARMALDDVDRVTGALREGQRQEKIIRVKAETSSALKAIKQIQNSQFRDKVQEILGDKTDAQSKIKQIVALGIPKKIAKILAEAGSARAAISNLKSQLSALQDKNITITTTRREVVIPGRGRALGSQADGRAAGVAETALVGEGGGPEFVVNSRTGESMMVSSPTLMELSADDYVIPTESRYRSRANSLLAALADDLGLTGYRQGRGGRRGGASAASNKAQREKERQRKYREKVLGKQGAAFSQHSLDWYDSEISKEEAFKDNKHDKGKLKGKLTARAKQARTRLKELTRERSRAKKYKADIDRATTEADIQLDLMNNADKADRQGDFNTAYSNRKKQIAKAIGLIERVLPFAPKGSTWEQSLRGQLAKLKGDAVDLAAEEPPSVLPEAPDETTFTESEQAKLEGLEAQIALAGLSEGINDDKAALGAKESFLNDLLGAVVASGGSGRGGMSAVTDIATELKSTRDQIKSLTEQGPTADQQAISEQKMNSDRIAAQNKIIDRLVTATIGGATAGAAGQTLVFQSYVPPSPTEAKRLADYTVGGIGYQGIANSTTERIGV